MSDGEGSGREDGEPPQDLLHRLDPDRAASQRAAEPVWPPPRPPQATSTPRDGRRQSIVDTRRYGWLLAGFAVVVVVVVSIYQFATNGVGTTGVPPGHPLRFFAAPLAATNLNGDPNLRPPCTLSRHDPRALNLCLLASNRAVVLSFFVIGSGQCERQVDALQRLSSRFPAGSVAFAAVAINAGHAQTRALVRAHHWTIPVAYDRDGSVGALYGVVVCPMVELADRGGTVRYRLIGPSWQTAAALAPKIAALLGSGSRSG